MNLCITRAPIFLVLFMLLPTASPLSFRFSSFDQNSLGMVYQNDSFLNQGIQLTKNQLGATITNSVGRAVYAQPVHLWDSTSGELADFTTHFSFVMNALNLSKYGDGLAFFLSSYPSAVPDNSWGGYLGLFSASTAFNTSANNIVAVEFDSFPNDWDPRSDHVGININSIASAANVSWNSSIKNGRRANAWVSYVSSTKNLSVFLTYADNPVFTGNSSLSYTVDLREVLPETVAIGFSAATSDVIELHTILSWNFSSSSLETRRKKNKKKNKIGLAVGSAVTAGVVLCVMALVWYILKNKNKKKKNNNRKSTREKHVDKPTSVISTSIDIEFEKGRGPKRFPYADLVSATKNFTEDWKLGEGGFGAVYKGFLKELDLQVAIKRVSRGSKQGRKEYTSEVNTISRLRHRNLVQLIGWCHERGEFMLVYELMPNGSLDKHLYGSGERWRPLAWPERYKVAVGLAAALLYLHEEWEQCVVHRDVKPSNVMLDSMFNAKLGDFGLARFVEHDIGAQTTVLAGTMGYLAPECVTTGKASRESDVYSFGVVALEIACGRRPVESGEALGRVMLVQWAWGLFGKGAIVEAVDERLEMEFEEQQMERLMVTGLWCAHPDRNLRPSIRQAIAVLSLEAPLPDLPPEMPVAVYSAPGIDMGRFMYTSSSGGGSTGTTVSNASSSSTSTCLLKSQRSGT